MNLNISYDAATQGSAPSAFFSAVNYVVGLFDATFTNNVTVNIEVGYGTFPFDGSTVPPLGESEQANLVFGNYSPVRQGLLNEGAPGATTLPATSPLGGGLVLGSAQERALGLIGASNTLDGWVGIASDATLQQIGGSWSYSATATPGNNQYYLVGVLEHEITEVMGRISYLDVRNEYGVMDLYRYKASGVRQTGTGGPAYFSTNGGATNLDSWNTQATGDIGDWAGSAGADAFLAFNPSGQLNAMTPTDLTLMSAIGWTTRVYFAPGLPANLVYTATGSTLPAPLPGQFNLELFNNGTGTGSITTAPGYQGVALVSADGRTVSLLHGDYGLVDSGANGGNNLIVLGDGSESIGGAIGDTILGGSGPNQFLDGHLGHQSITGGTAGNETIWGAATDTVRGGNGGNETIAGVSGETIFGSTGANVFINATGGNQSVLGGSAGNDSVWTGAGDTIHGGSNNATVGGVAGVTMIGGTGGNQFFDASQGHQSVLGGSGGNETIWGALTDTITGGSGGNETIGGVSGETILGGSGANVFIAAMNGNMSIVGGAAGNESVWAGAGDTIRGGSDNETIGGVPNDTVIGGSGGNEFIDGSLGHQSILGGSGGNETIWGAATDTITGGSAGNETIGSVAGESVTGGAANTVIDASAGNQWIALGGGNSTVSGGAHDTVLGASGSGSAHIAFAGGNETLWDSGSTTSGHDSVTNFSQAAGDRVSLATATDTVGAVLASATSDLAGNVVLHLHDNSSITLVGVTPLMLNSGFFTTH
jgi:hypothetical protein